MKFFATLAIAALAVVSAADVPACDPSLLSLATSPDATACTASTGFSAASLKVPAAESLAKVCADPACQKLLAAVTKAVPTECSLGGVLIKSALVDKFPAACEQVRKAAGGAAATANATASANATTTVAVTSAPAVTTAAPVAVKAGSTAGSSEIEEVEVTAGSGSMEADKSTTDAPSTTKSVPTPAPTKSSASSVSFVAAATGAVLVASAATLL